MRRTLWAVAATGVLALVMLEFPLKLQPQASEGTQLEIRDVVLIEAAHQSVILLSPLHEEVVVPVLTDALAGAQVAARLHQESAHAPDITQEAVASLGGKLVRVVLDDVQGSRVHAKLQLLVGRRSVEVESDPAAALALAISTGIPVVANQKVLDSALAADDAVRMTQQPAPIKASATEASEILSL